MPKKDKLPSSLAPSLTKPQKKNRKKREKQKIKKQIQKEEQERLLKNSSKKLAAFSLKQMIGKQDPPTFQKGNVPESDLEKITENTPFSDQPFLSKDS